MVWREQLSTLSCLVWTYRLPPLRLLRKHQKNLCVFFTYPLWYPLIIIAGCFKVCCCSEILIPFCKCVYRTFPDQPRPSHCTAHSEKWARSTGLWQDTMDAFRASVMHSAIVSRQTGLQVQVSKGPSSFLSVQGQNFRWHKLEWLWWSHLLLSH